MEDFTACWPIAATKTATLFNDRYGMHRIYYHQAQDAFYFAAEAKAILAVRPELRSVDPDGLGEFVSCGCTLKNRTVFKDIQRASARLGVDLPATERSNGNRSILTRASGKRAAARRGNLLPADPGSLHPNLPRYFNGRGAWAYR